MAHSMGDWMGQNAIECDYGSWRPVQKPCSCKITSANLFQKLDICTYHIFYYMWLNLFAFISFDINFSDRKKGEDIWIRLRKSVIY